ncbi:MAG TPA: hypothetical protein VKA27_02280 [Sunxiuqinia sp.]|nr:hypothetical protein [Sunxiuqinia sp.]
MNMKKFGRLLLWVLLIISGAESAHAQYTESRELHKRYAVKPGTSIEITNKYGNIEMNTWDKDSVVIDVMMKVEEKKQSRLDKTLDNIDFDFTNGPTYLIARTIVDKNRSQLESEFLKFKETLLQTDGSVQIDYKVWLPSTNPLKIENKFGNIYLEDYNGTADISLSNGKLKAHDLNERATINLSFADASINEMTSGRISADYSDIYIRESGDLRITSKSSEIELTNAKSLTLDSRRDKFRLRKIDAIEADASFSSFRMNELTDKATLRLAYGDLEIEKVPVDFSNIYIESKNTDISLYFNPENQFNFELTETKTDLNLGHGITVSDKKVTNEKDGTTNIHGYFNKKTETGKKLYINAISGDLNILGN